MIDYVGIFQGGGIKGIAHVGALIALEERGFRCTKAAGTSVGAIIASLVMAGYNGKELYEILKKLDLKTLKSKFDYQTVLNKHGLYSSNNLAAFLEPLLKAKNIETFLDLKCDNDYKLKVIGTDLLNFKEIIFPSDLKKYNINPDTFKVVDSVVMSASFPGFYQPEKLNDHFILDGGIYNNFPLDAFSTELPIIGFSIHGERHSKKIKDGSYIIESKTPVKSRLNFNISEDLKYQICLSGYKAGVEFIEKYFENKK